MNADLLQEISRNVEQMKHAACELLVMFAVVGVGIWLGITFVALYRAGKD